MKSKAIILLIESSSDLCSAAICSDDKLLATKTIKEKNSHSKFLAPMVQELLGEANIGINELSAVAISAGPGSYTGLRIGASLAKGICYAQNLPLIAVSSLQAIHESARQKFADEGICVLIDARRMDAYTAYYPNEESAGEEYFCTLDADFLSEELKRQKIVFAGSGAQKLSEILNNSNAVFAEVFAEAKDLSAIALKKYTGNEFEDLAYFEPNYIKSVHITAAKKTEFN